MKAHRTDGLSLAFSVVFLGAATIWLLHRVTSVDIPNGGWLLAGGLIIFGAVGLIGSLRSSSRRDNQGPTATSQGSPEPGSPEPGSPAPGGPEPGGLGPLVPEPVVPETLGTETLGTETLGTETLGTETVGQRPSGPSALPDPFNDTSADLPSSDRAL